MAVKGNNVVLFFYSISILLMGSFFIFQVEGDYKGLKSPQAASSGGNKERVVETIIEGDVENLPQILENEDREDYSFDVVSKSGNLKLAPGGRGVASLRVKNAGRLSWYQDDKSPVYLGTTKEFDRETKLYKEGARGWLSGNRILVDKAVVNPGQTATFTFEVNAPENPAIYRESFALVVDGVRWLDGQDISWDVEVREAEDKDSVLSVIVNGKLYKYIAVSLKNQRLNIYENGEVKYSFVTSTGIAGMDTPKGEYKIQNKFSVAYSKPYDLYMDNWMAFTPGGEYGVHSLPYWLLKGGGRLYEGENHLGTAVSHGCIRVSLENSKILYDWAEVGTPLFIGD